MPSFQLLQLIDALSTAELVSAMVPGNERQRFIHIVGRHGHLLCALESGGKAGHDHIDVSSVQHDSGRLRFFADRIAADFTSPANRLRSSSRTYAGNSITARQNRFGAGRSLFLAMPHAWWMWSPGSPFPRETDNLNSSTTHGLWAVFEPMRTTLTTVHSKLRSIRTTPVA
jgi:hypothetical protein